MNTLPSGLYLVSTPIGNARDVTLRALDVLKEAEMLIAEDTRTLKRLLTIHAISRPLGDIMSYHDFSKPKRFESIMRSLEVGKSMALVSEAGTPLVSDPGFKLVKGAIEKGINIIPVPGPSAMLAALTVSGIEPDRFVYLGFLPQTRGARKKILEEYRFVQATLIVFESPNRLESSLADMQDVLGKERMASICREMTKRFEEVRRGSLGELKKHFMQEKVKGEMVIVIERDRTGKPEMDITDLLSQALRNKSVKDAVSEISGMFNLPRKEVYSLALKLSANRENK